MMFKNGADINARNGNEDTPLHEACHFGGKDHVLYFIKFSKPNVNLQNKNGETCLHWAIRSGNKLGVKMLLDLGADLYIEGYQGSCLKLAEKENKELFLLLQQYVAIIEEEEPAVVAGTPKPPKAQAPEPVASSASLSPTRSRPTHKRTMSGSRAKNIELLFPKRPIDLRPRDNFGFLLEEEQIEAYKNYHKKLTKEEGERKREWAKYSRTERLIPDLENNGSEALSNLVRRGLPFDERPTIWYAIACARKKNLAVSTAPSSASNPPSVVASPQAPSSTSSVLGHPSTPAMLPHKQVTHLAQTKSPSHGSISAMGPGLVGSTFGGAASSMSQGAVAVKEQRPSMPSNTSSYFQLLLDEPKRAEDAPPIKNDAPDIEKDLERTFPDHSYFSGKQGRDALRRVLIAYSRRNPSIGYCQSMNFLAGFLLLVMNSDEEKAFHVLCYVIEDILWEYFGKSMFGVNVDQRIFESDLKRTDPELCSALDRCHLTSSMITVKWHVSLYLNCLPMETVVRLWDVILLEGPQIIVTTSLSIFRLNRTVICSKDVEVQTIVASFTHCLSRFFDGSFLVKKAVENQLYLPLAIQSPTNILTELIERKEDRTIPDNAVMNMRNWQGISEMRAKIWRVVRFEEAERETAKANRKPHGHHHSHHGHHGHHTVLFSTGSNPSLMRMKGHGAPTSHLDKQENVPATVHLGEVPTAPSDAEGKAPSAANPPYNSSAPTTPAPLKNLQASLVSSSNAAAMKINSILEAAFNP
eukprot:TRINITY_DN4481_c0_g1_i1.p1 TRINITY_DN4481_c0_g1~~TRINITY_DN4481_c0_g1_i1.p1  ORF type:complete len:753 (+),score=220.73 TRINITY_DN4481_c0_g1_i1:223-2481(+)